MSGPAADTHQAQTKSDTVSLTVNGKKIEIRRGTMLIDAVRRAGFYVPTLCHIRRTSPVGSCRICSVDVEGYNAPVMSCVTPVTEPMTVQTESDRLKKLRHDMIKFILVNHPLDCPVCERSGECMLQDKALEFGVTKQNYKTISKTRVPVQNWRVLRYDRNLCIMCERCVKICRETEGIAALSIGGMGYDAKIVPNRGDKLECEFCGQCWSVCPVGAINSAIVNPGRAWEMETTETVCAHCGVGCKLFVNIKHDKNTKKDIIARVTTSEFAGTNRGNLCFRGRFAYEFVQSGDRLLSPLVREGSRHVPADWDTAIRVIQQKIAKVIHDHGKNAFLGLGSERSSNEDNFAFQKFFRKIIGTNNINHISNITGPAGGEKYTDHFGDFPHTVTYDAIRASNMFFYIGMNGSHENPVVSNHVREAIYCNGAEVALAYSKKPVFEPAPTHNLIYDYSALNDLLVTMLDIARKGVSAETLSTNADWLSALDAAVSASREKVGPELAMQAEQVVALIRSKGKAVFFVGQEAMRHPQREAIVSNIVSLAKLTGAQIMLMREYSNSQGAADMGLMPNVLPGYKPETDTATKIEKDFVTLFREKQVKSVFIANDDLTERWMYDRGELANWLKSAELVVVMNQFYTEDCVFADVILPTTTTVEESGTMTNQEGRIQSFKPALAPLGKAKPIWEILTGLAAKMQRSADFGYASSAEITAEIAATVPGYSKIKSGRDLADFNAMLGRTQGQTPKLKWVKPKGIKKVVADGGEGTVVMEMLESWSLFRLGKLVNRCVSISDFTGKLYSVFHPDDAEKLGIKNDDEIEIVSPTQIYAGFVRLDHKIRPGTVRIPVEQYQQNITIKTETKRISCYTHLPAE